MLFIPSPREAGEGGEPRSGEPGEGHRRIATNALTRLASLGDLSPLAGRVKRRERSYFFLRQKRLERLARLRRAEPLPELLGLLVDALHDLVRRALHQPARDRDAFGRQRGDRLRGLHRLGLDLIGWRHLIDQAAGLRLLARQRLAHHQQLERAAMTHQARRQQARGRLGHQPERDERRREARVARRDRVVAMQHHRGADADRDALHGGDQRTLGARQRIEKAQHRIAEPLAAGRGLHEVAEIVAGRERAGHARDHDAADRRIAARAFDRLRHAVIHRRRERVLLVRPVHADEANRALVDDVDVDAHGCSLRGRAGQRDGVKPNPRLR